MALLNVSVANRIATVEMNRPEKRNAINTAMKQECIEAFREIEGNTEVRVVVLRGRGEKAFSAGADMFDTVGGTPFEKRLTVHLDASYTVRKCTKPVVAMVRGYALGGGFELALSCDIRIASESAVFAESFVKLGLISGDGGAWLLPRVVGASRAYEMTLTAEPVKAERALQWGLVSALHPADRLLAEARAIAEKIAAHPPHSLRLNKRLLRESERLTLAQSLELAAGMQSIVQHTDDFHEAVAAFVEKRAPRYKGA